MIINQFDIYISKSVLQVVPLNFACSLKTYNLIKIRNYIYVSLKEWNLKK